MQNTLSTGFILRSPLYQYHIIKVLGQGAFGITYLAETKVKRKTIIEGPLGSVTQEEESTMQLAIKEFFMQDICGRTSDGAITHTAAPELVENYRKKFKREAENLSKMNHEGIVKVIEVFPANNSYYYAMEYIDGGSLDDYIVNNNGLSEQEALSKITEIGTALDYMHCNKMLHLDLKPKNIMRRQNGQLVLIDFGLSKQYDKEGNPETSTTIKALTPGYAPLEQNSAHGANNFPVTIDVYALGATLYKMLTALNPPPAEDVLNYGLPLLELQQKGISDATIEVIRQAMQPRVFERIQSVEGFLNKIKSICSIGEEKTKIVTPPNMPPHIDKTEPISIPNPPRITTPHRQSIQKSNNAVLTTSIIVACIVIVIVAFRFCSTLIENDGTDNLNNDNIEAVKDVIEHKSSGPSRNISSPDRHIDTRPAPETTTKTTTSTNKESAEKKNDSKVEKIVINKISDKSNQENKSEVKNYMNKQNKDSKKPESKNHETKKGNQGGDIDVPTIKKGVSETMDI